ncbi:MAG: Rieske 2Fe-2S domain-containing protein [Spirulina sp. SIO3F2]|nr:Rieske 2Fe-2S domain-containing protein [Spirulina sp. SIO3F2]
MVASPVSVLSTVETPFDWSDAWYPVHFVQDLDKSRPIRFVLLGQPLVLWWQPVKEAWVVLSDRCSHRLAPLSEGRITADGCLECPYHGWAFTEIGTCDRIPFAPEDSTAHQSDRATIRHYPSQVAQGLLFVYAGDPANADTTPLPTVPPLDEHPGEWVMADTFRDIPYDATTLLENVLDTSHVAFTHHPRVGNRANAKDFDLEVAEVTPMGFKGFWEEGPRRGKFGPQVTTFLAPSLMWHDIAESPFGQVMTVVYAVPTEKGKCRAIVRLPFRFKSSIPRLVFKFTPRWFGHLNQNSILEDDQIFLHLQERSLAEADPNYTKACYLPTGSDRFVLAYRQWVQSYGAPFPEQAFAPAETDRAALLERYYSHTINCQSCQGALRLFRKLRLGSAIAAVLFGFGLPFGVVLQWPLWVLIGLAVVSVLSLGAWWQLGQLIQRFYEGEYPPTRNYKA